MARNFTYKDTNGQPMYPKTRVSAIIDFPTSPTDNLFVDCAGDGVTDDADVLQELLNRDGIKTLTFPCKKFYIGHTLNVNTSKIKYLNGQGATIIVGGSFPAFTISGTLVAGHTAHPSTLTNDEFYEQSWTQITGFKIRSNNSGVGIGIYYSGCYGIAIRDNIILDMNIGIQVHGQNRDGIIVGNKICKSKTYGLYFDSSCNYHQLNINDNLISYAKNCIRYDRCNEIANHQIVGNDIEIDSFDSVGSDLLCIYMDGTGSSLFSEFEIIGNTIQGHHVTQNIISLKGLMNCVISGNHIGNSLGNCISIENITNININSNNFRRVDNGYLVGLKGNNQSITINSNSTKDNCNGIVTDNTGSINKDIAVIGNILSSANYVVNFGGNTINGLQIIGNIIRQRSTSITTKVNCTNNDLINISNNILNTSNATDDITTHGIIQNLQNIHLS